MYESLREQRAAVRGSSAVEVDAQVLPPGGDEDGAVGVQDGRDEAGGERQAVEQVAEPLDIEQIPKPRRLRHVLSPCPRTWCVLPPETSSSFLPECGNRQTERRGRRSAPSGRGIRPPHDASSSASSNWLA